MRRWNHMVMTPIQTWRSDQIETIYVSEGLSNRYMAIDVREFVDTSHILYDGHPYSRSRGITTTLAMADLKSGEEIYAGYIREVTGAALKHFKGPPNELVHRTYRLACEMYQDPTTPEESVELLKLTFKLWTAARLSTLPTFIVGHSALDMGYCTMPQSQMLAKSAPVPPFLGAQLKLTLLHHIQETIAPNLVAKLQSMMSRNNKHTWLALYLTTFMLLHNTTLLMAHALAECRSIGGRVRLHSHQIATSNISPTSGSRHR